MDPGRRRHYAEFYDTVPDGPLAVVWGNCQAEALRVLLAGSDRFPWPTVRVPPVHELTDADLPHLDVLLPRVALLVAQPVRPDYRGLPLGTDQVASRLAPAATVVRWPVIRWSAFFPYQAIVRHPADPSLEPPVVAYHDLRTIAEAAGRHPRRVELGPAIRAVAQESRKELVRREQMGIDLAVSDCLSLHGAAAAHTVNHPGNGVLIEVARRVQRAAGAPDDAGDPGRELLGRVRAPLEPEVLAAHGLDGPVRTDWSVDGVAVGTEEVRAAHLAWYRDNPTCVEEGLRRHGRRMARLGL